jgi:hypothetical protein
MQLVSLTTIDRLCDSRTYPIYDYIYTLKSVSRRRKKQDGGEELIRKSSPKKNKLSAEDEETFYKSEHEKT